MTTDKECTSHIRLGILLFATQQAAYEIISAGEENSGIVQDLAITAQEGALEMEAAVVLKLIQFLTSRRYLYTFPLSYPPHCRFEMVMSHDPLVVRIPILVTNQPLMVMSVYEDAGAAGGHRRGTCLQYLQFVDLYLTLGTLTRPSLSSDERSESLEVDQRGIQNKKQESLDLEAKLNYPGAKNSSRCS